MNVINDYIDKKSVSAPEPEGLVTKTFKEAGDTNIKTFVSGEKVALMYETEIRGLNAKDMENGLDEEALIVSMLIGSDVDIIVEAIQHEYSVDSPEEGSLDKAFCFVSDDRNLIVMGYGKLDLKPHEVAKIATEVGLMTLGHIGKRQPRVMIDLNNETSREQVAQIVANYVKGVFMLITAYNKGILA